MNKILKCAVPLLVIFFSCSQKDILEDGALTPVFTVSGVTSAGEYLFEAGVDSVYLFTDYTRDSGMLSLTGTFSNAACVTDMSCPGSLSFTFKIKENQAIPTALNIPFLNDSAPLSEFQTLTIVPTDTSNRDYVIQLTGAASNNVSTQVNIFNSNPVDIQLYAQDRVNAVKSTSTLHYLPSVPDSCKGVKLLARVNNQKVTLLAETAFVNPTFSWSDSASGLTEIISDYDPNRTYAVTISGPDAGCSAVAALSNLPGETGNDWISSTGLEVTSSGIQQGFEQTGVRVNWTDHAGFQFSSGTAPQIADAHFVISKVEPYLVNEKGQKTVKVHIRYTCALIPTNVTPLEPIIMSGSGIIGVALPY